MPRESAFTYSLINNIDRGLNAIVLALARRLDECAISGLNETIPTFRSLTVFYEPVVLSRTAARRGHIAGILYDLRITQGGGRTWRLPVCYDPEMAPDLIDVAGRTSLTTAQVVERHSGVTYHVYMLGFLPGLAYMGDVPPELVLPRLVSPRQKIPAGMLGIAMAMSLIMPRETPSGLNLIGRSPVAMWRHSDKPHTEDSTLLAPGDNVIYQPISLREYELLAAKAAGGEPRGRAGEHEPDWPEGQTGGRLVKPALHILNPGLMTTVQDLGRSGFHNLGIGTSGALDPVALRLANLLVGNEPGTGGLEVLYLGPAIEIEAEDVRMSFVGAAATVEILPDASACSGTRIETMRSVLMKRGEVVCIGSLTGGAVLYVGVEGGFDIQPILGSVSTNIRGGTGAWRGRAR